MGLWRASSGRSEYDGASVQDRLTAGHRAARGSRIFPNRWAIFAGLTGARTCCWRPDLAGFSETRLQRIHTLFPILKDKLAPAGGPPVRRAEADARHQPRHRRAAASAADRRTTKGLATFGHRPGSSRRSEELKRQRTTILLGRAELPHGARARRRGRRHGMAGRIVHAGRMEDLAADEYLQDAAARLRARTHQ